MIKVNGANSIGGEQSRQGTQTFTSVNPRTKAAGETLFYEATAVEIDRALTLAADAFAEMRLMPAAQLADFFDTIATEIEAIGDLLLQTADWETGLGLPRLTGERGRTTNQLRAFAQLLREGSYVEAIIDTALPDRHPLPRPSIRRMLSPIGPTAVFTPNNFPLAFGVAGGDTASALAAGCPVILKGHPSHPATSELVAHAINQAVIACQMPLGAFALVQGKSIDVGQALVKHPLLSAVAFTGSLQGGRAIFNTAASRDIPIPVYAEMGSINPIIILPEAIAERGDEIAAGLVNSITLGSGQFCTNPGLVFLQSSVQTDGFIAGTARLMGEVAATPLLNRQTEQSLMDAVAKTAVLSTVQTRTGGHVVENGSFCYAPTLMTVNGADFLAEPTLQREHFGPVSLFVLCADETELTACLDALSGNLTATIHAGDGETAVSQKLFTQLREKTGRLVFNQFPTGVEVSHAMQHGGPYPATTMPHTTSVGMTAIKRFMRPIAYQNLPDALLPLALQDNNPLGIWRIVDGEYSRQSVSEGA